LYTPDRTDHRIVAALQADAKLSYEELGKAVGLSGPAAFQRVRKLESAKVITGYHARIDPAAIGKPVVAFVRVRPGPGVDMGQLLARWRRAAAIVECHRVTGADGYLLKLRLDGVAMLSALLDAARAAGCNADSEVALETVFER
jgi:Lrp/AsnC family transcriptional regulator, leucine-responsive regulatory protein